MGSAAVTRSAARQVASTWIIAAPAADGSGIGSPSSRTPADRIYADDLSFQTGTARR